MTRPLRLLSLLILLLLIVRGSEAVLEAILDNELPPLLTEELGLPVRIAPLRADIFSLTAMTDRLEMGEPDRLSVDARDVRVKLNWSDLLRGEIRLVAGDGRELMLDISAWPEDDDPPSEDYANLEQWLPSMLDVGLVRYRREDGTEIEFHDARWRRAGEDRDNASLAWQSRFPTGRLDFDVDLASLDDFLWLRRFDANLTLSTDIPELPISELALAIQPGGGRVYDLSLAGNLAGLPMELSASGSEAWSLPDRSQTRAEVVDVGTIGKLVQLFVADGKEDAYEGELATTLPAIDLPRHKAQLDIDELRIGKEMLHNVGFRLTTTGSYLAATRIRASGLYGDLLGSAAVASSEGSWEVALAADLTARAADKGLLARYVESHWYARQGRIRLKSRGTTTAELLDDLNGALNLTGAHRGDEEVPVAITAKLDGSPDRFALEQITLQLGDASIEGQLEVSTQGDKYINLTARGDELDLAFLSEESEEISEPGAAVPTFLTWLPGYRVTADLSAEALQVTDVWLRDFKTSLDRGTDVGKVLVAGTGPTGGSLEIELGYQRADQDRVDTTIDFRLNRLQLNEFFGLDRGAFDSRTSGTIALKGQGNDVRSVIENSRGRADLDVEMRSDSDWSRPSKDFELIDFTGQTRLVLEGDSIVGIVLEQIDIDSLEQDLTGSLSLIVTREPVMVADLTSERLNIDRIVDLIPTSTEEVDDSGFLEALRDASPGQITLRVDTLTWLDRNFDNLELVLDSKPGYFAIERLDLGHRGARLSGATTLDWIDPQTVRMDADASITALRLLEVLDIDEQRLRGNLSAPLAGQLRLQSEGQTLERLLLALSGELLLENTDPNAEDTERLDITFERLPDGGLINFRELKVAGSDIRGSLRTTAGEPTRYVLDLAGGTLDVQPWTMARKETTREENDSSGPVQQTADVARNLAGFAGRMFGANNEPTAPGERLFDSEPFDLTVLEELDLEIRGKLGRIYSGALVAEDFEVDALVGRSQIKLVANAAQVNGGPLSLDFRFDGRQTPIPVTLEVKGEGVHRRPEQATYPTSMHAILKSSGISEAELAANLNGQIYLELGRGPIDYRGLAFITADAATSMFRALIPGARDRVPEVRCGATFVQFTDGVGITPYGYAVRTRSANLLGGLEVNLADEQIRVRFRSRSREGVGISIGNAFSGSVELAGPLSDPRVVPNTPGLLVRGWAAFMTAGLSVLGESVFNRMLASDDPCGDVQREIRRDLCSSDQLLSGSPLACPAEEVASN